MNEPKAPSVLVTCTNNSSQACVEAEELLTEEKMLCETENFLEYCDELAEKIVVLRNTENPARGLLIRSCDSSRYFEGGKRKAQKNIKNRFGKNYVAPGTFVTLTYDHQAFTRWEAWERTTQDLRRFLHNITMRYKRAGRKNSPRYIWVIEEQSKTGYPHVHIFYPKLRWLLSKEDVASLWGVGRTRVEYAQGVNIGRYICKYITKMGGWSDEALAFLWTKRMRMYGYSRCYSLPAVEKKAAEWMFILQTKRDLLNDENRLGMLLMALPEIENLDAVVNSS